jgi:hypothetical protein
VGANGERVVVGVEYPWLPVKCKKCKSFGHLTFSCTKVEKQVWVPRRHEPIQKELPTQKVFASKTTEARNVHPGSVVKDQWNEVRSARRTPVSKPIIRDSQKHWTNSFHLLARVDGRFESGFAKDSGLVTNSIQQVIEQALNEESENILLAKGKGKMGEDEEVLMRGFSPTT